MSVAPQKAARVATVVPGEQPTVRVALWRRVLAGMLKTILPLALLAGGAVVAYTIVATAPVAERKARPRVPRLVETIPVTPAPIRPALTAWGEVRPARTLMLRPEIAGRVTSIHPNLSPGGVIAAGEPILSVDDRDLRLAVQRAEADIAEIRARQLIEAGQAAIGERELSRLSRNLTDDQRTLVLREPQRAQLEAELAAAEAALAQAELAVERAAITTPFDAIVISETVSTGAMLTQGTEAAELVGADRFHIALALPTQDLAWLDLDDPQPVRLTQPGAWGGAERTAGIERLNSRLTQTGRMAELIVALDDPLARTPANAGQPAVLLGAFLEARIPGRLIDNAVLVDRAHLRSGDTVWLLGADQTLEVRTVEVAWRGPDHVLVSGGLDGTEKLITTALATHAPGMALRTREGSGAGG